MPKGPTRRSAILALAVLATALISCSREAEQPAETSLLAHVPADTPYVFAASEPFPEALRNRLMAYGAAELDNAKVRWREGLAEMARRQAEAAGRPAPTDPADSPGVRVVEALLDELSGKLDAGGLAELGFKPDARSVVYGLSLFPAMRLEIADPARVEALLARVEQRSGEVAPRAELNGQRYRRIPLEDKLLVIVAVQDRHLVAGVLPTAQEQRWLPLLLGQQLPGRALAATDTFSALQQAYGYRGYGEGYLDIRAVSRILTGQDSGANGAAWQSLAAEMPRPSPGCRGLVDKLVAGVPRLVVGVTGVSDRGYDLTAAYETSAAVGEHLQRLAHPAPLPGMGMEPGRDVMASFGMDIDVPALREGIKALLRFVVEQGRDCEWVKPDAIQAAMPKLDLALGPMLAGFNGAYTELSELRINQQTLKPDVLSGGLLLAVNDPRGVLGMAAMVNPALAQLELPMDGSVVAVPAELLPPDVPAMHLAAREGLLAIAVGEGSQRRAGALLNADRAGSPMLMSGSYDMARFMGRMAEMMELLAAQMEAAGKLDEAQRIRDELAGIEASAKAMGRVGLSLAPEARGLVIRQQVLLR